MQVLKDKETNDLTGDGGFPFKLSAMTKLGLIGQSIERKLNAAFAPDVLAVEDESARHAGHAGAHDGGESHFRVRIVSAAFRGINRVERQRRIYAALAEEFSQGLHALSLTAQTPEEMSQTPKMR
jgi:BolA protein